MCSNRKSSVDVSSYNMVTSRLLHSCPSQLVRSPTVKTTSRKFSLVSFAVLALIFVQDTGGKFSHKTGIISRVNLN